MRINLRETAIMVFILLLLFGGAQFSIQSFRVQGNSMEPSFHDSEYLIVDKLSYRFGSPSRGDVIIFHNPSMPSELYVKRVVGLPGERISIRDGRILVNGIPLEEDPAFEAVPSNYDDYSTMVPLDSYFVMGDNRRTSSGSHIFKSVPKENIVGRVWIRYWPWSEISLSPSYSAGLEQVFVT